MKNTLIALAALLLSLQGFSQTESMSIGDDFKALTSLAGVANINHSQTGYETFSTYNSNTVNGTQFFVNGWTTGSLTTPQGQVIKSCLFLYDKVRQVLFARPKDTNYVVQVDGNIIKSFTLNADKPYTFIQATMYDSAEKGKFFEVLSQGDNYIFLKLNEATFEKANTADMEKVKSGDMNDAFVDHPTYYIYHAGKLDKFSMNEYSITKALKPDSKKVDAFFDRHSNDEVNDGLVTNLVNELNGN